MSKDELRLRVRTRLSVQQTQQIHLRYSTASEAVSRQFMVNGHGNNFCQECFITTTALLIKLFLANSISTMSSTLSRFHVYWLF